MKFKMPSMARKPLTLERKIRRAGFLFLLPWLFGIITFFVIPFINTIIWSFQDVNFATRQNAFIGGSNYHTAILRNRYFLRSLWESTSGMFIELAIILVFSFFIALVLNQKFRGRTIARALFFVPVIVATSIVIQIIREDIFTQRLVGAAEDAAIFQTAAIERLLFDIGLPRGLGEMIGSALSDIFDLTWRTGMQIILFLSGLQAIPESHYEVASIEGANAWDSFWKITAPMVTPSIMLVVVYTIIDTFTDPRNPVMRVILSEITDHLDWGVASAMAIVLFLVVGAIVGLVMLLSKRFVFYNE